MAATAGPLAGFGLGTELAEHIRHWLAGIARPDRSHYLPVGGISFIGSYLAVGAWLEGRGKTGGSGAPGHNQARSP